MNLIQELNSSYSWFHDTIYGKVLVKKKIYIPHIYGFVAISANLLSIKETECNWHASTKLNKLHNEIEDNCVNVSDNK